MTLFWLFLLFFVLLFLGCPIYICMGLASVVWILTNQRVVLVNSDYAYYIRFKDLDAYRVVRDQTENPTVFFGSRIFKDIGGHLLWRAAAEITTDEINGDEASCFSLVYYNTVNADNLIKTLKELGLKEG